VLGGRKGVRNDSFFSVGHECSVWIGDAKARRVGRAF
jgi:hypothetical protein